jgi:hypothetical protein
MDENATITKMYEIYGQYHDTKEKMAWLGISFYAAFTLGIIRIFTAKDLHIQDPWTLGLLIVFLTIIVVCIHKFLIFHYKNKRRAAKVFDEIERFLSNEADKIASNTRGMVDRIREINKEDVRFLCSDYKSTEVPIISLLFILFATQVSFLSVKMIKMIFS